MYRCQFPYCSFETNDRMQIESHHIIPKSQGGTHKKKNRIWLCRGCHAKVYIPNMKAGIHCKNNNTKIQLLGWMLSSGGRILEYKTFDGNIDYW